MIIPTGGVAAATPVQSSLTAATSSVESRHTSNDSGPVSLGDILSNVIAAVIISAVLIFLKALWVKLKGIKENPGLNLTLPHEPAPFDHPSGFVTPSRDPHAKLSQLSAALAERELSSTRCDLETAEGQALVTEIHNRREDLRRLMYLDTEDVLDERFRLIKRLSCGDRANVWLAEDQEAGGNGLPSQVAIKILSLPCAQRPDAREWYFKAIQRLGKSHIGHTPHVYWASERREGRAGYIPYYAMEHIKGVSLGKFVLQRYAEVTDARARFELGMQLTESLMEAAGHLAHAHADGLVHGDLHPDNFIVLPQRQGERPRLFLIDFDTLSIDGAASPLQGDASCAGYKSPEVIEGFRQYGAAADIFSLARIIVFLFSGRIPSPHAVGSNQLINHLDCPITLRQPLLQATSIVPGERPEDLRQFVEQIQKGLASERNAGWFAHWRVVIGNERGRISQTLKFAFFGALFPMLATRPFLAHKPDYEGVAVHLSDMLPIGAFHATIGSFIWAVFITAGYLFCQSIAYRSGRVNYWFAASVCGLLGFVGGVAVALLGAGITNACTLHALGWITAPPVECGLPSGIKIAGALESHLLWAFPLTGTFTGIGLGVWLNIKVNSMIDDGIGGVVPIPKRTFYPNVSALANSFLFAVGRQPLALLWLTLPIWASLIAYLIYDFHSTAGVVQAWRSAGEGVVHSAAALGVGIAYFRGVAPLPFDEVPQFIRAAGKAPRFLGIVK